MQLTILSILGLASSAACYSVQINYYYDTHCQQYAGTRVVSYDLSAAGETYTQGGPSGSQSGLYVSFDCQRDGACGVSGK